MNRTKDYFNKSRGGNVDELNDKRLDESGAVRLVNEHPKIPIVDYSQQINPKATMNFESGKNGLAMQVQPLTQDNVKGRFSLGGKCIQVGYYNPTTTVIKLSLTKSVVDTASYEYIINANKMGLLPALNFTDINYLQETIQTGFVLPLLYFYECVIGEPTNSSIT